MATVVMNSAMMPLDGTYTQKEITQEEFVSRLLASDHSVSSLGYPTSVDFIKRISGLTLSLERGITKISADDDVLVVKLKYRIDNPASKNNWVPKDEDHEFFIVSYKPDHSTCI